LLEKKRRIFKKVNKVSVHLSTGRKE